MSDYAELVKAMRYCSEHDNCGSRCPRFECNEDCVGQLTKDAANAIEELLKRPEIPDSGIGDLSDGYHTFNGLYYQRMILFAALVRTFKDRAWKSYRHEDGELCFGGGWFVVGIDTPEGSYTYHYENKDFDKFDCVELPCGKQWDGHTEADVTRLLSLPDLCTDNNELRMAVFNAHIAFEELNARMRWRPVSEKPQKQNPKHVRERFIVHLESGCVMDLYYEFPRACLDGYTPLYPPGWHTTISPVTHWMPLPEPPKGVE